jgi:hypothetical protein
VLNIQTAGTTAISIDASQAVSFTNSPTVTGGTANGVAYLNGSKVLTTGSALTFSGSALAVTGSISSTGGFTSNTTITAQLDGSDSAGAGPGFNLFNTAFSRGWRTQLSASNNKVDYYFNGSAYVAATTIDTSGNLLVGATSALNSEKQYIYQSSNGIGLQINCVNASQTDYLFRIRAARNTTNGTFNAIGYYNDGAGAYKFIVADSGNVTNANNSYGAISDVKLKENIVDATPKLADLMQVKVRQYNLKSDPSHKQLGVIAQELEAVFPSMIEETPDRDAEGNELSTKTKAVKYSVFVPMLIKAMQEQQAIITQLQADVAALKGA